MEEAEELGLLPDESVPKSRTETLVEAPPEYDLLCLRCGGPPRFLRWPEVELHFLKEHVPSWTTVSRED